MNDLTQIKKLLELSQEMCEVLREDKEHLIQRNMPLLHASDEKKQALLESIQHVEAHLQTQFGRDWRGSVSESVSFAIQHGTMTSSDAKSMHQALTKTLNECQSLMQTNQRLLKASLSHIQEIFQKLNPDTSPHNVYERPR